jgi:hypothetical protein
MRAIMPVVLPDVLSWRKRRGLDRWDEMWDGELHGGKYRRQRSAAGGWVRSSTTGIELRNGRAGKLSIRLIGNDDTRQELPED